MKKIAQTKRLIIVLLFGTILFSCNQNNELELNSTESSNYLVDENIANKIANNYIFNSNYESKKTSKERKIKEVFPVKDEKKETVFYIINYEKKGFLILSADKRISPVLAYSENNEFRTNEKSYNSGIANWLNMTMKTIQIARENNIKQTDLVKAEWDIFLSQPGSLNIPDLGPCALYENEIIEPLLSTRWEQGNGFNAYMPFLADCDIPGGRAWAGCVPLAIAQIMKYHEYPSTYNWDDMPNRNNSLSTAGLIRDIHQELDVEYDCEGTGVNNPINPTIALLTNHYNYSTANKSNFNSEIIKQELSLNRPVLLKGSEDNTQIFRAFKGHFWVCDGVKKIKTCYSDENGNIINSWFSVTYHMNWGWGGDEDGWYAYGHFDPSIYSLDNRLKMIYNIKP